MTGRIREILERLANECGKKAVGYMSSIEDVKTEIDQALSDIKQEMVKGVLGVDEISKFLENGIPVNYDGTEPGNWHILQKLVHSIHEAQVKKL